MLSLLLAIQKITLSTYIYIWSFVDFKSPKTMETKDMYRYDGQYITRK